jgi:hypothetical protein
MRVGDWFNHKNYGGWTGIFGGKGNSCKTCKDAPIFSAKIEITAKMNELNLTADETQLHLKIVAK